MKVASSNNPTSMKGNIGVWIDLEKAVLIALDGEECKVKTLPSQIDTRIRVPGESDQSGRFGNQFVTDETSNEARRKQQIGRFVKKVVAHISGADAVVVFGPAQMKIALKKVLEDQPILAPRVRGIEAADLMTENQMIAWVKAYFND